MEHQHPEGIVYLRVSPAIAFNRIKKRALPSESGITLDYIEQVYKQKEELFIENKNNPVELQHLPVLVLNGNIDFQTDFAQFYNHLFYIKRFLNQIQEKKDIALGIYKKKPAQRHCC
jgi:deoxycitidine kinase